VRGTWGLFFSNDYKFQYHIAQIVKSANCVACQIFRSFSCKDKDFLVNMFKVYVRPILEYASVVWSPYLKQDINRVESVQRRFTKRIPGLSGLSYRDRLKALSLQSLYVRRIIADLSFTYNIVYNRVDVPFDEFFTFAPDMHHTRGNIKKLSTSIARCNVRKYFFAVRVVKYWNNLCNDIVLSRSIAIFKRKVSDVLGLWVDF
jgi:hypothetical protein